MTTVSIIIPTAGKRPELLRRAIGSALSGMPEGAIEILLIPNGPQDAWTDIEVEWAAHPNVKLHPIPLANVSAARNEGIRHATGMLVRFLDDDDFLIPEIAQKQYLEMLSTGCDLSTYGGRIEDESGMVHQIIRPITAPDYACAVLGPQCPALTFASTYRKELIESIQWNKEYQHTEDEDWMRRILSVKDPSWLAREEVVGVWFQHANPRLSKPVPVALYYMNRAVSIIKTTRLLELEGRLNSARSTAAACGLWSAIHGGFYFSPIRWTRIAKYANHLDENSHPASPFFTMMHPYLRPIIIEWLVLPKRWFNHLKRIVKGRLFGWNRIRKI